MVSSLRHSQFFYTTAPLPCPYLPNRTERKIIADLAVPQADALHSRLSRAGFRRSHTLAYAPMCENCAACIPIRLPVNRFTLDRTQKRTIRRNADLRATLVPPLATPEQYALFARYQDTRHTDGEMANMTATEYRTMVEDTPVQTLLAEFRTAEQTLIATCLIDQLEDGLSAVYSFYEPDAPQRSLGSFVILALIEKTKSLGLPYLYLGYWVRGSAKMTYKSRYRPAEILHHGTWQDLNPKHPPEGAE
ncbi:arginyltransferase [Acetobacter orientalis]|uniref:arginyltransferase n=1 Tax=Acetobacter orientalis TaxID=146474 RepID=UPI0039E9EB57